MRAAAAVGGIGVEARIVGISFGPDRLGNRDLSGRSRTRGLLIMRWRWLSRRWSRLKVRRGPSPSTSPNLIFFSHDLAAHML